MLTQDYSWVGAFHLYNFLDYSNRGTPMSHTSDLVVGDIVQADWGDGRGLVHTMLVSTKKNDGTVYLSFHSIDTLDRLFSSIVAQYPAARFFAWHINDSFSSLPKPQPVARSLK